MCSNFVSRLLWGIKIAKILTNLHGSPIKRWEINNVIIMIYNYNQELVSIMEHKTLIAVLHKPTIQFSSSKYYKCYCNDVVISILWLSRSLILPVGTHTYVIYYGLAISAHLCSLSCEICWPFGATNPFVCC